LLSDNYPYLTVNSAQVGGEWQYIRKTNNYWTHNPVQDVSSADIRCYTSETGASANTTNVAAGSTLGFKIDPGVQHPGVLNVYMAKAPSGTDVANWDGSGSVWFKIYQIGAKTDGGSTITWPTDSLKEFDFTIPKNVPSGQYLVRVEHIALHGASSFGGGLSIFLICRVFY
jgi:hypothetical protein